MYTGSTDLSDVRNVNENKYVNRKFKKGGISVPRAPVLSMGNIDYSKFGDPYKHILIICFINYRYMQDTTPEIYDRHIHSFYSITL